MCRDFINILHSPVASSGEVGLLQSVVSVLPFVSTLSFEQTDIKP